MYLPFVTECCRISQILAGMAEWQQLCIIKNQKSRSARLHKNLSYEQAKNYRNHFHRGCIGEVGRHVGHNSTQLGTFLDGVFWSHLVALHRY